MNFKSVRFIISRILYMLAIALLVPLIVSLIYKEALMNKLSFLITSAIAALIATLLGLKAKNAGAAGPKEGLIAAGFSWILISLIGALPYVISGFLPNYVDAFFEACSGFSTTGSTVVNNFNLLSSCHSLFFYRSLTQFMGGMGVLVFILTVLSNEEEKSSIHFLKAESTGPSVGKLTGKMKNTTRILYLIYLGLFGIETILLWISKDLNLYDSICLSMSTVSTGGFGVMSDSVASYSIYVQYIIIIFMILSGVNFSNYYLIIIKKIKLALKNEELITYFGIIFGCSILIVLNTFKMYDTVEKTFRYALFNVASLMTTTGFVVNDYTIQYPLFSQIILLIVMLIGGCAGSTAGGIKVSRMILVSKNGIVQYRNKVKPNEVKLVKMDDKVVEKNIVDESKTFIFFYLMLIIFTTVLLSLDKNIDGLTTALSSSISALSNVGPTLGNIIGATGNFSCYSSFSKILLSIEMLTGRLELFPILILFSARTYKKF